MRQLNKIQTAIFLCGGTMMVIGVALNFFGLSKVAPWTFLVGAVGFASMQMLQTYGGNSLAIRRLRRILLISDILFVVSGLLMVENVYCFTLPLFVKFGMDGLRAYNQYVVHNNWVVTMLIAAIIQIYTTHRLSKELEREQNNQK